MNEELQTINKIISTFQPVFDAHKGGAEVVSLNDDILILKLLGHCQGCALAPLTFALGIEKLIKEQLPSIKEIRYTN